MMKNIISIFIPTVHTNIFIFLYVVDRKLCYWAFSKIFNKIRFKRHNHLLGFHCSKITNYN